MQALIRRVTTSVTAHVARLPVLRQDALLYTMAAVFSAGESVLAVTADYREWGRIAAVPYLLAAVACEVIYRRRHNRKLEAQLALDAGDEAKLEPPAARARRPCVRGHAPARSPGDVAS